MSNPKRVMVVWDDKIQTRPGYPSMVSILLKLDPDFVAAAHRACSQAAANRDELDSPPISWYVRFTVPRLPHIEEVATKAVLHYQGATGTPAGLVYLHYVADRDPSETVDLETCLEHIDYAMSGGPVLV